MTAPDAADELVIDNRDHSNSLLASFARLRERQILCDITLKVDEEAYPVHRALLSAASSFFEAMFTCGLYESTATEIELHVAPIPARVFGLFLDFLYTGRVSLPGGDQDLLPMLCLADEYGCQALTRRCLPLLSQRISSTNCIAWLQVADSLPSCESWRAQCLAFVLSNFAQMPANDFMSLRANVLYEIVASPLLRLRMAHEPLALAMVSQWLVRSVRLFRRSWKQQQRRNQRRDAHLARVPRSGPAQAVAAFAPSSIPPSPVHAAPAASARYTSQVRRPVSSGAVPRTALRPASSSSSSSRSRGFDPFVYANQRNNSVLSSSDSVAHLAASLAATASLPAVAGGGIKRPAPLTIPGRAEASPASVPSFALPQSPANSVLGVPPFFSYAPVFARPDSAASRRPMTSSPPQSEHGANEDSLSVRGASPASSLGFSHSFLGGDSRSTASLAAAADAGGSAATTALASASAAFAAAQHTVTAPGDDLRWLASPLAAVFALLHHVRLATISSAELDSLCLPLLDALRSLPVDTLALPHQLPQPALPVSSHVSVSSHTSAQVGQNPHGGGGDSGSDDDLDDKSDDSDSDFDADESGDALDEWRRCGGADWAASPVHAVILQQLRCAV